MMLARAFRTALQAVCPHGGLTYGEERRDGRITRIIWWGCHWCGVRYYLLGDRCVTAAEFDAWWRMTSGSWPRWCRCPPEPPIDYGRGFLLRDGLWHCTRCDGVARPDQQPAIDGALRVALEQMPPRTTA